MLGDLLYEESSTDIQMRELGSDENGDKVEVTLQTSGEIQGVGLTSAWTYWSLTRPDGTIYGEGTGVMTTAEGDVINLIGNGSCQAVGEDGSISYRGSIHFSTASEKFAFLNGGVGVHEYEVSADGTATTKVWHWT